MIIGIRGNSRSVYTTETDPQNPSTFARTPAWTVVTMSRLKSHLTRTLMVLLLAGALVATPTAAQAGSFDRPDAPRDVARINGRDGTVTAAPNRVNGDIIRTVFRHKTNRVRIRIDFADLQRSFPVAVIFAGVATNEGVRRVAAIDIERPRWGGEAYMSNRNENRVRCAMHHSVNYRHNVVIIGFPRTCVSKPQWVRIFVTVYTVQRFDELFDHALVGAPDEESDPPYSPRINRGNRG